MRLTLIIASFAFAGSAEFAAWAGRVDLGRTLAYCAGAVLPGASEAQAAAQPRDPLRTLR